MSPLLFGRRALRYYSFYLPTSITPLPLELILPFVYIIYILQRCAWLGTNKCTDNTELAPSLSLSPMRRVKRGSV